MIQAESDPQKRDEYLQRLMELPNQARPTQYDSDWELASNALCVFYVLTMC